MAQPYTRAMRRDSRKGSIAGRFLRGFLAVLALVLVVLSFGRVGWRTLSNWRNAAAIEKELVTGPARAAPRRTRSWRSRSAISRPRTPACA